MEEKERGMLRMTNVTILACITEWLMMPFIEAGSTGRGHASLGRKVMYKFDLGMEFSTLEYMALEFRTEV